MSDLRDFTIATFTNSSKRVAMSVTHIESGITASGVGYMRIRLRDALIEEIELKLARIA